ncbi:MAG: hypothetical protein KF830_17345 [Planctomycetes bacterium]|nr:hypothetical protein [Planctomycetota bacterium]
MADDVVRSPGPVGPLGGFAGRSPADLPRRRATRPDEGARAVDRASIHLGAAVATQLLRERVLAATRRLLDLDASAGGPEFAEVAAGEPVAAFLGRLLSAQNQLAARRAGQWSVRRVRRALDRALQAGAAEALELLSGDDGGGREVVAAVLAEYARRLAALAARPS